MPIGFSFGASADPRKKELAPINPLVPQRDPWSMMSQLLTPQPAPPPIDFEALFRAMRPPDVQGERNKGYMPGTDNQHNPFSNGFFNQGASALSSEARQATQGNSAMTQWARLGGVPGVEPNKLEELMSHQTPMPGYNGYAIPAPETSDPFFRRKQFQAGFDQQGQTPGLLDLIRYIYGGASTLKGNEVLGGERGAEYVRPR